MRRESLASFFCLAFSLSITISRGFHFFFFFSKVCALLGILMLDLNDFIPLSLKSHNKIPTLEGMLLRDLHGEPLAIATHTAYLLTVDTKHRTVRRWTGLMLR